MSDAAVSSERHGWTTLERVSQGAGHRVLLLPGLFCTAEFYGEMLADPLLAEAGVAAIAANPPGFAGRPTPAGFDFSIERYAELVEEFAASEAIDLIAGHSLSANFCIEIAARRRFQGPLLLLSPSLSAEDEEPATRSLADASRTPVVRTLVWLAMNRILTRDMRPRLPEAHRELLLAEMKRTPHAATRAQLLAFFDHVAEHGGELAERLATAVVPTWVGRGDRDEVTITDAERETLEQSGNVELKEIPGSTHFSITDEPPAVNRMILQLLNYAAPTQAG